jgi:hypothetical protein
VSALIVGGRKRVCSLLGFFIAAANDRLFRLEGDTGAHDVVV